MDKSYKLHQWNDWRDSGDSKLIRKLLEWSDITRSLRIHRTEKVLITGDWRGAVYNYWCDLVLLFILSSGFHQETVPNYTNSRELYSPGHQYEFRTAPRRTTKYHQCNFPTLPMNSGLLISNQIVSSSLFYIL